MTRTAVLVAALTVAALGPVGDATAQVPNAPHATFVYPAGGRQGTTVKVKIGGRYLEGVSQVVVSGTGVSGGVLAIDRPLNPKVLQEMRDKAQALQKQLPDPAIRREIAEIRAAVADSTRRNQNPNFSDYVTLELVIDAGAEPGLRQLRLLSPAGLSEPLVFCVGQLPECLEDETLNGAAGDATPIALPAIVNGRMIPGQAERGNPNAPPRPDQNQYVPGDVDRFRFHARKGADLVVVASARELMPYLADAVPGWFQATLALYDAGGQELAYDDDYKSQPDPVLHYRIPADGAYVVAIKDALFRGREDFVYRIAIGEIPFVTSVYPLGGRAGGKTTVAVMGWNLPATTLTVDAKGAEPGAYSVSMHRGVLVSNRIPFALDTLPERAEAEPNNTPGQAQRLVLPLIVDGRIQVSGDTDVFSIVGTAGETVVAEVTARRLGSPLDSVLELTDAAGGRIAINDDHDDKSEGLITHQADSYLRATLPASGTYFLRLGDTQRGGGAEYAYRLRVSAPRPDFEVRVTPSTWNTAGSATVPVTATIIRKDGFDGDVALTLANAAAGLALSGAVVPRGTDRVRFTVTAPAAPTRAPVFVTLDGRAGVAGRMVTHRALAADEMMQAFAYHHLVPADALRMFVSSRGATRVPVRVLTAMPLRLPVGGTTRLRVELPPGFRQLKNLEAELSEPPDGLTVEGVSATADGFEFVLRADRRQAKTGLRGNLIVNVSGEREGPARGAQAPSRLPGTAEGAAATTPQRRRVPVTVLPAIAIEITPPSR
jgi:hypothetical protein